MTQTYRHRTPEGQFWNRIERRGDGCWIWQGARQGAGYGTLRVKGKTWLAHRWAWIHLAQRDAQAGLQLDHLCRVRECVNYDHLRLVTNRENALADGALSFAAINARKTHCKRGHEFTPENTYSRDGHSRQCRACVRIVRSPAYAELERRLLAGELR